MTTEKLTIKGNFAEGSCGYCHKPVYGTATELKKRLKASKMGELFCCVRCSANFQAKIKPRRSFPKRKTPGDVYATVFALSRENDRLKMVNSRYANALLELVEAGRKPAIHTRESLEKTLKTLYDKACLVLSLNPDSEVDHLSTNRKDTL